MAIKWSPGCGCCGPPEGCGEFTLGFTPSSPLSRGEYDHLDYWQPYTEYLQGDQFLQQHLDPDSTGKIRTYLWQAPQTMFSGPGWTYFEMSRYSPVSVVDYIDRPEEWLLYGDGWPTSPLELERLVEERKIPEVAGIVSAENVIADGADWNVNFQVRSSTAILFGNSDFPPGTLFSVDFMVAKYEGEDTEPSHGNFTTVANVDPLENPHCEYQSGSGPPPDVSLGGSFGTFTTTQKSTLSDNARFGTTLPRSVHMCRSKQPTEGTIVGSVDVSLGTGQEPLDIFDLAEQHFASITWGASDWRDRNKILVVKGSGVFVQGAFDPTPSAASDGDLLRVIDHEKLAYRQDGAFEKIAADAVELNDIFGADELSDIGAHVSAVSGAARVALFVETYEVPPSSPEEAFLIFSSVSGSKTATLQNPDCPPCLAYDCPCEVALEIGLPGTSITDVALYPLMQQQLDDFYDPGYHMNPIALAEDSESGFQIAAELLQQGSDTFAVDQPMMDLDTGFCSAHSGKYSAERKYAVWKQINYGIFQQPQFNPDEGRFMKLAVGVYRYVRGEEFIAYRQVSGVLLQGMLGNEIRITGSSAVLHPEWNEGWTSVQTVTVRAWYELEEEPTIDQIKQDTPITNEQQQDALAQLSEIFTLPDYFDNANDFSYREQLDRSLCDGTIVPGDRDKTNDAIEPDVFAWAEAAEFVDRELFDCGSWALEVTFPDDPFAGETVAISSA